jgi:hypothetical protein
LDAELQVLLQTGTLDQIAEEMDRMHPKDKENIELYENVKEQDFVPTIASMYHRNHNFEVWRQK